MPPFRISLASLLGIVAVIALGLAGMVSASSLLDHRGVDR